MAGVPLSSVEEPEDWKVFEATTAPPPAPEEGEENGGAGGGGAGGARGSDGEARRAPRASGAAGGEKEGKGATGHLGGVGDGLDEADMDPVLAFEVFAGRQYVSGKDLSDSIAKANARPARGMRPLEAPLDRYRRLKAEVAELAADVAAMSDMENRRSSPTPENVPAGSASSESTVPSAPWHGIRSGLQSLEEQLAQIAKTKAMREAGLSLADERSAQAVLSRHLLDSVQKMGGSAAADSESGVAGKDVTDGGKSDTSDAGSRGGTYEIYLDASAQNSVSLARLAEMEARFNNLEKLIGMDTLVAEQQQGKATSANLSEKAATLGIAEFGPQGLLGAVSMLEEKMNLLSPGALDTVGRRVASLSAELERVSRLRRENLGAKSASVAGDAARAEDAEKVSALFDLLERLQGLDKEIPGIVERLHSLQLLHQETAVFSSRLQSVEEALQGSAQDIRSCREIAKELSQSVAENAEVMLKNVAQLDERLNISE